MDLTLVLREIEAALTKVIKEGVTKSQTENDSFKITVYRVGGVVRVDIKEK